MEAKVCTILVLGNPRYPLLDLFSTVTYFDVKTWPRTARWDRTFMSTCGVACEDYGGNGTPPLSLLQPLSYNVKWRNRKCMSRYVLTFRHSDDIGSHKTHVGVGQCSMRRVWHRTLHVEQKHSTCA